MPPLQGGEGQEMIRPGIHSLMEGLGASFTLFAS